MRTSVRAPCIPAQRVGATKISMKQSSPRITQAYFIMLPGLESGWRGLLCTHKFRPIRQRNMPATMPRVPAFYHLPLGVILPEEEALELYI